MKHLIIVEHKARMPANRLWNDLSIHAYALAAGVAVVNLTSLERGWTRRLYWPLARLIDKLTRRTCSISATAAPKLLPPSAPFDARYISCSAVFFFGWMFRNPLGMESHRAVLLKRFAPPKSVQKNIENTVRPHAGKLLIGICRRTKPFEAFPGGEYLLPKAHTEDIAKHYAREAGFVSDIAYIEVCDDEDAAGLWLLARCSVVVGDNSPFANLAAWLGNSPHIVATDAPVDWAYYKGKDSYFENKYATFALGSLKPDDL